MSLIQKTINDGGRFDGSSKMFGGIQFNGNTNATVVGGQNTWVRIGAGAAGHTLFTSIQTASTLPYWTLAGATTAAQTYTIEKCKADTFLTASFGGAIQIPAGGTISNVQFRLRKTAADGVTTTTLATADACANVLAFNVPFAWSTIVSLDKDDSLFIELQNTTAAQNVTVVSAYLILSQ